MARAPHPVTLRQLQYVVAIAEAGSFRKAAAECRVAQPSLSAQVAQAEAALGVRLFERDRRRVAATAAGRALVEHARATLLAADELVAAARSLADPFSGTLRVGVIPTVAPYLLPEVAPALRAAFPQLTIAWVEEKTPQLVARLERGDLDAMLVALQPSSPLPHVVLGEDRFVFAAPPGHSLSRSARAVDPRELDGERLLLLDDGHCLRDQALEVCGRGRADEAGYRATSLTTLVQMVAGGAGVTLLPTLALDVENRHRALVVRPFAPRQPGRTLALAWRRGSAREVVERAVGEALRREYARLVARRSG